MKIFKAPLMAAMVGVSALGLSVAVPSMTQAQAGQSPVPIDVWALRNVVNAVQVSPDGKHILVHINPTKDGEYLLMIYKTDDLSKPFRTLNADPMEIIGAQWVSDNVILGQAWQVKRKRVSGPEDDVREYALLTYDLEANKFNQIRGSFGLENTLPDKPDSILVSTGRAVGDEGSGVDPFAAFRPRSYYEVNLEKGTRKLITKGTTDNPSMTFDNEGNPRVRTSINRTTNEVRLEFRMPGESGWKDHGISFDQDEYDDLYKSLGGPWGPVGFSDTDPEIVYMLDYRDGADKAALWKFNARTGEYVEKLYENPDADVMSIQTHSLPGNNKLVAAVYPGAKYERHWFDEEEKALYEALEQQIPFAHQVSISSRSRDGNTMIVSNTGPQDPGSFWLVKDGKMAKLGSRNPQLVQSNLAEVKYIRYKARDGLEIPAYVTVPKTGKPPYPLVVQHNGGPHVNAVQGYSEMSQMLASAGYMVLYPQNRISTGWGKKHFDAGFGEHGLKMQDDKDDGVKYLIEQGLVDPDRVAFFGWSYGGYAALVATSREEQLYQCAVAVAAVADPAKSYRQRSGSGSSPKAIDEWAQRRGMIGINPINEVSKINIPFLMVHGDVDRRVLYWHYTDYKKAVEEAGKGSYGQFLTLKGADHFGATLMFEHQQQFYTKLLDYLKNDCGPGGL